MPADSASLDGTATERRPWLPAWLRSESPVPWLLPAAALMVVFGIYPLIYAITLSLYKRNAATRKMVLDPGHNWTKILTDERVWNAIYNTFFYTGVALAFQLVLGMLIALLLDSDRKGYGVLRAMMTLPLVIPPAVTGMMFLLMLNGSFGVLSMLAGLRSLPKEPFEAAAIDGANAFQAFFRLTLPMMSKVIAIAVLIRGIDLFRAFDYIKVMTDSGPGTATETLTSYAGRIYFGNADFPYASTVALLTLIIVILVSTAFMQLFRVKL